MYDPLAVKSEVYRIYNLKLLNKIKIKYDVIILAVAHDLFLKMNIINYKKDDGIIYDVKSVLDKKIITARL